MSECVILTLAKIMESAQRLITLFFYLAVNQELNCVQTMNCKYLKSFSCVPASGLI